MTRTTLGFEMRAVGENRAAAAFAGIPVNRVLLKTALLSGGLAALAGFSEVAGLEGQPHARSVARASATPASSSRCWRCCNPLGVVVAAIFVAGVFVGADAMSRAAGVPSYIADILLATALLTMVAAVMLTRFRVARG